MTRPYDDDDAEKRIASAQAETSRQLLIRIQDLQAEIERLNKSVAALMDENARLRKRLLAVSKGQISVPAHATPPKRDFKPKFMNGTGYGPDD